MKIWVDHQLSSPAAILLALFQKSLLGRDLNPVPLHASHLHIQLVICTQCVIIVFSCLGHQMRQDFH